MKRMTHFEVVQVISRFPDGKIEKRWPGDEKLPSEREARALAVRRRKEFPDAEFAVIRVTVDELPIHTGKQVGAGV